jgi:hypothetical protein
MNTMFNKNNMSNNSVYLNNSESNNRIKSQKSYTAAITIFLTFNSKTDNVNIKKKVIEDIETLNSPQHMC